MKRRTFLQTGWAASLATPLLAALRQDRLDEAAEVLSRAASQGQVTAAVLHVMQGKATFSRAFGKAKSADAMFLLGWKSQSNPKAFTVRTISEFGKLSA